MLVEEISVEDLHALGSGTVVIDVRETDEWADGHVPHARHVVLGTVPDQLHRFDGSPTYVICKVGGRSLRACEFAAAQGHHVVNVSGGMLAWRSAGFDVATGSDGIDA
ncbi:MAG: rhodanese-like domain-containing protein [Ilumatobacter sp.]|nr:rhodanese-like domain-containing protein [Ilumatobacter sp.]